MGFFFLVCLINDYKIYGLCKDYSCCYWGVLYFGDFDM